MDILRREVRRTDKELRRMQLAAVLIQVFKSIYAVETRGACSNISSP